MHPQTGAVEDTGILDPVLGLGIPSGAVVTGKHPLMPHSSQMEPTT